MIECFLLFLKCKIFSLQMKSSCHVQTQIWREVKWMTLKENWRSSRGITFILHIHSYHICVLRKSHKSWFVLKSPKISQCVQNPFKFSSSVRICILAFQMEHVLNFLCVISDFALTPHQPLVRSSR